MYLAGKL